MKKWINLEIKREVVKQIDEELNQDKFEGGKKILELFQGIVNELGEGLFLNDQLKNNCLIEIENALNSCGQKDYEQSMNIIENQLIPKVISDVLDYNKAAFLSLLEQSIFCLTHDGDYFTEGVTENVGECTTFKIKVHL